MEKEDLISILIVDDHAIVRQGLNTLFTIQSDFQVVGEAENGEIATALAAELVPDIVLMDLVMPGTNGIEAIRMIKQVSPRSQVIVLTSYHEDEYIFPALRAGAISYVLKDIEPNQLVETVRRGVQGESIMHPRVAARVVTEIRATKQASPNPFSELSERELEVLRLIARGLTNAEIAKGLFISEKTVKGHVSNILSKLHMLDRTKAAVFAWEQGYMRPNQEKNY
ncbi:response regulator [Bacillus pseudomycoides]|uniref:DNA-binding response regulator n=1 Tax=Bacillus pseudomycoides TaxID=64104 RepID=A0A2C3PGV0_9BACI|nr:response regulator transcription factor [Bacillus pseudomycoides]PEA81128.1 DNA-binding response regulator [Bacillus pseudomycoides]PED05227.1 DNA-binding response regulator [Bacillus pseudomycoides]PED68880.1 DNA-binding response regulator [Bacillus pseudomycoides]PEI34261.1 DNA-binding response regulator [Bacillus pseudomycoides]PEI90144.1 DNA-binding response regulator [Bacillus pseudomycoides]